MLRDWIYVTERRAIEGGLTHEGTLFGIPAWLREDGDDVAATAKVPLLELWCLFADSLFEVASWFMPEDAELPSPITLGRKIG